MMLSSIPEYEEYGRFLANEEYDLAIESLKNILSSYRLVMDADQAAYILGKLGRSYFLNGDADLAFISFLESEKTAPDSYLTKYHFARFLLYDRGDVVEGLKKCNDCVHNLLNNPFEETDEDFGSDAYVKMFKDLIEIFF